MAPEKSPASRLLVHGAGSDPSIYSDWPSSFPSIAVLAADLHLGLDVARATHADYAERVVTAAGHLPVPVSLCGWSMGGLAVLQAAAHVNPHSVILLDTSPPAEVQGFDPAIVAEPGAFEPEEVYGPFPGGVAPRRESSLARAERKRGISIPSLPCPSLVAFGGDFPEERGLRVARLYGSDQLAFPELDHWDLVLHPDVRGAIAAWLGVRDEDAADAITQRVSRTGEAAAGA
jgi:pimeloyl-ACP methyl ester carboxylesterase